LCSHSTPLSLSLEENPKQIKKTHTPSRVIFRFCGGLEQLVTHKQSAAFVVFSKANGDDAPSTDKNQRRGNLQIGFSRKNF
jgi:hypothetical protein